MHSLSTLASVAAIAAFPLVSAHGYVQSVTAGGQTYAAVNDPSWIYAGTKPQRAGWFAQNQDNGFVSPSGYGSADIACHKGATAGTTEIPVTAGSTITLQWNTWPDTHHGPVIDALAKCSGSSCTSAKAGDLNFFKIAQKGLIDGNTPPGQWATDQLISAGNKWSVKIPSTISAGSYVLRHELIGLHSAGSNGGAQNYPQCINLKVTGGGSSNPSGSKVSTWYKATDPGILISIYQKLSSYVIPGPSSVVSKRDAVPFEA